MASGTSPAVYPAQLPKVTPGKVLVDHLQIATDMSPPYCNNSNHDELDTPIEEVMGQQVQFTDYHTVPIDATSSL